MTFMEELTNILERQQQCVTTEAERIHEIIEAVKQHYLDKQKVKEAILSINSEYKGHYKVEYITETILIGKRRSREINFVIIGIFCII